MPFVHQPQTLPGLVDARTANVRRVNPQGWWDSLWSHFKSWFTSNSVIQDNIQDALNQILNIGVHLVADYTIQNLDYKLGGTQQPMNASWTQACKWAVVLIIVASVICAAMIALVVACIVVERYREKQEKLRGKHSNSDDEAANGQSHKRSVASGSRGGNRTEKTGDSYSSYDSYSSSDDDGHSTSSSDTEADHVRRL